MTKTENIETGHQDALNQFVEFFKKTPLKNFSRIMAGSDLDITLEHNTCSHDFEIIYGYTNHFHPVRKRTGFRCIKCGYEYNPLGGFYFAKEALRDQRKRVCQERFDV